ncbi:MAG: HDIG domain-containing protein [Candidatus Cyclonatronum sp.]|uniref:HD family phosphohydrolase n=1 Tax=Cyclonatronum sp. TaxID=3024185 RepID=UPI0025BF22C0|nr:HDIG domain-containing metalloprotein [Cyclonatronum sp.]MCH8485935.1 HDIG domain-containing protein [Cyclonatronum sp.]
MSLLEKLGLDRKKNVPPKGLNDKARLEEEQLKRKNLFIKLGIAAAFLILVLLLYPRDVIKEVSYQINEPWRQDDLTAPFDFSILKTDREIESEIQQIRQITAPVFHIDTTVPELVFAQMDSVMNRLNPVLEAYTSWKAHSDRQSDTAIADSLSFQRIKANSNLLFTDSNLNFMLLQYARIQQENSRQTFVGDDVRTRLQHLLTEIYRNGVIDIPKSDLPSTEISVRNTTDRTERFASISTVRDMEELNEFVSFRLNRMFRDEAAAIAVQLYAAFIQPNLLYNETQTRQLIDEAIGNISPTKGAVAAGQVIIRRGDLIDQERLNMLQSLEAARASRASNLELSLRALGDTLLMIAILATFLFYLYLYRQPIFDSNSKFLLVFIALFLVVGSSAFLIRIEPVSEYLVPLALAPLLLTIFFDSRVGIIGAISISLMTALMNGYSFEFLTATLVASSIGVYSVRDIRQRSQYFLNTPGIIFLSYAFVLLGFTLSRSGAWDVLGMNLLIVFVNVLLISILTYPLIFLFEKLFQLTTDVTLYELNDNNNSLLKELMFKATGSFQHSVQVANLTEAAAAAIGANALLARVGALYHDIGKMEKPQYFVENQGGGVNPHDQLTPAMSAKIIRDHVKAGVRRAQRDNLPPVIVNFIETHHGNSIIQYFYNKALMEADSENEVHDNFFRYEGPLPSTKETGILLMADAIEAASRAMSDPSHKKLENLVNRIVDEKVAEGQLIDCPLTFRDISLIKQAFLKNLSAMHHSRIKYPGQDKKDNAVDGRTAAEGALSKDYPKENGKGNGSKNSGPTKDSGSGRTSSETDAKPGNARQTGAENQKPEADGNTSPEK